jgi:hypothetical protein
MSGVLDVSGEADEFRLIEAGLAATNRFDAGCRRCEYESSAMSKRTAAGRVGGSVLE